MHLLELVRHAGAAAALPRARWRRRNPLVLRHDRAAPGRRVRPGGARRRRARRVDGEEWVIDGAKRFISGRRGRGVRDLHGARDEGPTMFLSTPTRPVRARSHVATTDSVFTGGHCEVRCEDCHVGYEAVLGEVGQGFQLRPGPAAARAPHALHALARTRPAGARHRPRPRGRARGVRRAAGRARSRAGTDRRLVIDVEASRSLIRWAAGRPRRRRARAGHETSVAKVYVAEAVCRVIDRSIQLTGGDGVTDDLPLARFLNEVRPFRTTTARPRRTAGRSPAGRRECGRPSARRAASAGWVVRPLRRAPSAAWADRDRAPCPRPARGARRGSGGPSRRRRR